MTPDGRGAEFSLHRSVGNVEPGLLLRRLQVKTSRTVTSLFAGEYRSIFKGRGLEFQEVRQYQPGDDVRFIDWNVTARSGEPQVKQFSEERQLVLMLLLDISASTRFGSRRCSKRQLAAELCSLLSFAAVRSNDRVGLILYSDRVEGYVPPRRGSRHALRIGRAALLTDAGGSGTDLGVALDFLNRMQDHGAVACVLSDFHGQGYERALAIARRRHDVVAICINDPAELQLPRAGLLRVQDPENGASVLLDTENRRLRDQYHSQALELRNRRSRIFRSLSIDQLELSTDVPYLPAVLRFFRARGHRP